MKRAIFFVLLIAMNVASFCQNLVVNPGFETWTKITRPTGWTHVENCIKDSAYVISGSYSCMHGGSSSITSDLGQTIQVLPGKEYRLSLFNKTIIISTGKGSRIWCYWKDEENNSIDDPSTNDIMRPSQYFKSETWQQYDYVVLAPPEAVAFYLEVRTNTNSIAYWDDFVFEESVATMNHERDESPLAIYPNPAHNYLTIKSIHHLQYIVIQNFEGTTILSRNFPGEETVTIPVSGIPDGLYIIRIHTSEKLIIRKFIKKAY
ncbi:MAG TPA: T9SS type A sorting domain-containing protein [Bacteroidales bacterium]|nr:T9SS type A sorting domain-containing protein [Bacteroidales bacterium]